MYRAKIVSQRENFRYLIKEEIIK